VPIARLVFGFLALPPRVLLPHAYTARFRFDRVRLWGKSLRPLPSGAAAMGYAWARTPTTRMLLLTRDVAADRAHPAGIRREREQPSRAWMQLHAPRRFVLCDCYRAPLASRTTQGLLRPRGHPLPAPPSRVY
jgi:hypothetical protein